MKIAWLSPFFTNSAIGKFSKYVTDELSKHAEVDIWVDSVDNLLPTGLRVIHYNALHPLNTWWPEGVYDFAVCNFGDCMPFHRGVFEFSRKVAYIAVLHDYVMHNFFVGYYHLVLQDLDAHLRRIEVLYGEEARIANELAKSGKGRWIWDTDRVVEFPFYEDCLSGALGVIAHSHFLANKAAEVFRGPVRPIPLAYPINTDGPVIPRHELPFEREKVLLVTVGNVNANKRVASVIEILAANPDLARQVYYVVCGHAVPAMREQLEALIAKHDLTNSVRLNGSTPDLELRSWLTAADACINLRNPAMEGGSASLAELMHFGKPAIVSDTGVYSEIPDECVLKVRPSAEKQDLAGALQRLVSDKPLRLRMGRSAREYARSHFTAEAYCSSLLNFLQEVAATKPVMEAVQRTGRILLEMGISAGDPVASTVAEMSWEMFCRSAGEAPWRSDSERK